jgi:Cu/Ag efflux protein CusF
MNALLRRLMMFVLAVAVVFATGQLASAQDPQPAAPAEQEATEQETLMAEGELVSVDTEAKTLTIKKADGSEMQFSYSDATEISGAQDEAAGLATEAGSQVTVHYTSEGETHTASQIRVQPKE